MDNKTFTYLAAMFHDPKTRQHITPISGTINAGNIKEAVMRLPDAVSEHGKLYSALVSDGVFGAETNEGKYFSAECMAHKASKRVKDELAKRYPGLPLHVDFDPASYRARIEIVDEKGSSDAYEKGANGWIPIENLVTLGK